MREDNEEGEEVMDNSGVDDDSYEGSAMLESQEFNEIERDTMKGDTIGDTVYSSKWIINTLISLSKVYEEGWSSDLEDTLCMLWDMTGEKDVVKFLLENDFLKMAEFTLKVSEEPRLTEIILGIVGNMCCEATVLEALESKTELITIILGLLHSDDAETLVQIIRILQASAWNIQKNLNSIWLTKLKDCEFLGEALIFILNSSTKDDLLMAVLEFLSSISNIESKALKDLFNIDHLIPALLESISQIMQGNNESHTNMKVKTIDNWLTIVTKITKLELLKFEDGEDDEKFTKMTEILFKILRPYIHSFNLIPLDEQICFCIYRSVDIIIMFQRNQFQVSSELIWVIIQIMGVLLSAMDDFKSQIEEDPENAIKELSDYLQRYWIEILGILSRDDLANILRLCDREIIKELVKIASVKTSKEKEDKLVEVVSCLNL